VWAAFSPIQTSGWAAIARKRELMRTASFFLIQTLAIAGLGGSADLPADSQPLDQALPAAGLRQQIEEDWLRQAKSIQEASIQEEPAQADARGGCDGVKDGRYGFHTAQEPNPWWQVDLGEVMAVARVVVFNRLDYAPGLHNADRVRLLTSLDGEDWTLRHENQGKHFGGISGAPPLEVSFAEDAVQARFVRLQIPSETPVYFHLDEVEIYGPGAEATNLALRRPARQSSISQWSVAKPLGGDAPLVFSTGEFIESGRRLEAELRQEGVNCAGFLEKLIALEERLKRLPEEAPEADRRELYLQTRWTVRGLVFANPLLDFDRLLFIKRFTQETYPDVCLNHMPWVSRPGGDICALSAADGGKLFAALADPSATSEEPAVMLRQVLNGALGPGHVHGLDLWWDGDRVVFGYARSKSDQPPEGWLDRSQSYRLRRTEEPIRIFEIGIDGRNLRQLTFGEWSDLDPTYAPNGDIVFVSERCGASLQCNEYDKDETSCNLYVMKPDGGGIRRLSVNKDGDYLPHTLDNGAIAYTRWEYHERSWALIQSIWTIRPDGTGADAVFKQHFDDPWALVDTRSIPGSAKLVSIATGHHTLAVGPLVMVDLGLGVNEPKGISIVTPGVRPPEGGMSGAPVKEGGVRDNGGLYSTPWALSEEHFLVSYTYSNEQTDPAGYGLYLVDVFGNKELLYRDPAISSFIPIPLRPRPLPPILAEQVDLDLDYAVCLVTDASFGSEGIEPEQVRYIRVAEPLQWPYDNERGGQRYGEDHGYSGPGAERKNLLNWTPIRIYGDVPVERDGSAHFKVPPDTALYFQLLDENRMELRRMRSFISFQPGEVRACSGCHETRGVAPVSRQVSLADKREPWAPIPPPWGERPVSFLRDVQPVLDRHCVSCHGGLNPAGGLDFFGGLTTYDPNIPGYGHNRAFETIMEHGLVSISQVRQQDSSITPPLAYGSHKSKLIEALGLEPHPAHLRLSEEDRLRLVIWIDANAPYHDGFVNKRPERPPYDLASDQRLLDQIAAVHHRRCGQCHEPGAISRLDWIDLRQPELSLFLSAPLAKEAGGSFRCPSGVYRRVTDQDYRALLDLITVAVGKAWESPRRDLRAIANQNSSEEKLAGMSGK
jgi:mono/diheme cytochrome c family protein